jgi:hypothetical protein
MELKAFDTVAGNVGAALEELGFRRDAEEKNEKDGRTATFVGDDIAYSVLYRDDKKRFELRSCETEDGKPDGKWKTVSMWLFDPETDTASEAQSIAADFTDSIRGPQNVPAVKTKKKKKKEDETNVDPPFFFNRFVGVFPELKDEINAERETYGNIRSVAFARDRLLPKIEALCADPTGGDRLERCSTLLSDLYVSGDMDVRSLITIVILNGISGRESLEKMKPFFGEELQKGQAAAQKIRGKTFKPEKKKKQKAFTAETLNDMKRR